MPNTHKTVFFLGAGFSKEAGGPIQNEIITTIFSSDFLRTNSDPHTKKAYEKFVNFLKNGLNMNEDEYRDVVLEDVFTPIDRCIAEGRTFRNYSHKQLVELHEYLHHLLAKAIQYSIDKTDDSKQEYITKFAEYINVLSHLRLKDQSDDRVAVLTTNWDILLDNALNDIADRETEKLSKEPLHRDSLVVVDYCCHISSLDSNKKIKPGLLALGSHGYNLKYLKLHGSMNWLHCPNCQRLYVKYDKKTMFDTRYCKHCRDNYELSGNDPSSIKLYGKLLLPTFVKNLSNIQLQLVWFNAGIELSEASELTFIGYSLPYADFEVRQLLSRFVRKDAKINVVIYPNAPDMDELIKRYKTFFGKREIEFIKKKVPDYVNGLLNNEE